MISTNRENVTQIVFVIEFFPSEKILNFEKTIYGRKTVKIHIKNCPTDNLNYIDSLAV